MPKEKKLIYIASNSLIYQYVKIMVNETDNASMCSVNLLEITAKSHLNHTLLSLKKGKAHWIIFS